ncbi:flagellar basal body P-ring formation chaperone FlgA [Gemmatimonas sp.]|jgi:flagella basal body P-ring formation protein FlgA|uniref:flagellar basal body P-ring formation chaperone FlgA n=1 Tax=Gemmatimonas sp. TaxID=1962908 RepID=UPI0022C1C479|nr:flagellar basal body P-ring formation chaperone FlgA [Gemmatimonas sp.]MCZ8203854.1 flagellar basal body P-ring formation chaperone FlgA [Gemmatimonas sp.]
MYSPTHRPAAHGTASRWSLRAIAGLAGLLPLGLAAQAPRARPDTAGALRADQRRVSVAVALRQLGRGDTLRAEDIGVADTVITWRWNGMAPDTTRAQVGWIARRPIAVGERLRLPAVTPPPVIASGTPVTAVWRDGLLTLVLSGVATNSAALGAPVGVRINRTRRLDGVAVAPNTVRLR